MFSFSPTHCGGSPTSSSSPSLLYETLIDRLPSSEAVSLEEGGGVKEKNNFLPPLLNPSSLHTEQVFSHPPLSSSVTVPFRLSPLSSERSSREHDDLSSPPPVSTSSLLGRKDSTTSSSSNISLSSEECSSSLKNSRRPEEADTSSGYNSPASHITVDNPPNWNGPLSGIEDARPLWPPAFSNRVGEDDDVFFFSSTSLDNDLDQNTDLVPEIISVVPTTRPPSTTRPTSVLSRPLNVKVVSLEEVREQLSDLREPVEFQKPWEIGTDTCDETQKLFHEVKQVADDKYRMVRGRPGKAVEDFFRRVERRDPSVFANVEIIEIFDVRHHVNVATPGLRPCYGLQYKGPPIQATQKRVVVLGMYAGKYRLIRSLDHIERSFDRSVSCYLPKQLLNDHPHIRQMVKGKELVIDGTHWRNEITFVNHYASFFETPFGSREANAEVIETYDKSCRPFVVLCNKRGVALHPGVRPRTTARGPTLHRHGIYRTKYSWILEIGGFIKFGKRR